MDLTDCCDNLFSIKICKILKTNKNNSFYLIKIFWLLSYDPINVEKENTKIPLKKQQQKQQTNHTFSPCCGPSVTGPDVGAAYSATFPPGYRRPATGSLAPYYIQDSVITYNTSHDRKIMWKYSNFKRKLSL